jgi:hypothetical protein
MTDGNPNLPHLFRYVRRRRDRAPGKSRRRPQGSKRWSSTLNTPRASSQSVTVPRWSGTSVPTAGAMHWSAFTASRSRTSRRQSRARPPRRRPWCARRCTRQISLGRTRSRTTRHSPLLHLRATSASAICRARSASLVDRCAWQRRFKSFKDHGFSNNDAHALASGYASPELRQAACSQKEGAL